MEWQQPTDGADGNDAIFGGTAGTVTIDGNRSVTSFVVNTSGYIFQLSGTRTLTITGAEGFGGTSAQVTWGSGNFVPDGKSLLLSSHVADKTVDFQNPIALAGAVRTIAVRDGAAAIDAVLSGALSGTGSSGLNKTGLGTLVLLATNTYSGTTTVAEGTLLVNGSLASGGGAVPVASGAALGGTGTIDRPV